MRVRPMTDEEFAEYREQLVVGYAQEQAAVGRWSAEEAEERSRADMDGTLTQGAATPGQVLLVAEDDEGRIGVVWIGLRDTQRVAGTAWLNDIEVDGARRGQGHGRALLTLAEEEARRRGAEWLGLNVFGHNETARRLYASAGYDLMTQQMRKRLRP